MANASATRTAARERSAAHVSVLLDDQLDDRALDALLSRLEAIYGQATAVLGGDATARTVVDLTGADALTLAYDAEYRLIATLLEQRWGAAAADWPLIVPHARSNAQALCSDSWTSSIGPGYSPRPA